MERPDGTAQDPQDPPDPPQIEQAARTWGVETDYWDIWGKQHHASPSLEAAILRSLGVDLRSRTSLHDAIELRRQRQLRSPLAPTIFLTAGNTPQEIAISLRSDNRDSPATLRIQLEDGSQIETQVALGENVDAAAHMVGGVRTRLPLTADVRCVRRQRREDAGASLHCQSWCRF